VTSALDVRLEPSSTTPRQAKPLDLLYEAPSMDRGPVRAGLPADLRRAYDGDLAIPLHADRLTVIANFVESLDGAVALDQHGGSGGGAAVSGFNQTDRFVMGLLRAMADVVLVGAGTVRASSGTGWTHERVFPPAAEAYAELRSRLGLPAAAMTLIVTAHGDLDPTLPVFRRAGSHIVIAAPMAAAERLRGLAFRDGIRIESLGDGDTIAPDALIDLASRLGARLVLTEGGPHLLAGLADAGLLDELFLTVAPQLVGRDDSARRLALLEGAALAPDRARWGQLASIRRSGNHLFLRYRFSDDMA
jgi:riboflavin biosynthesis pyrimidine reductase